MSLTQYELDHLNNFIRTITEATEATGVSVQGFVVTTSGDNNFALRWNDEDGGYEIGS